MGEGTEYFTPEFFAFFRCRAKDSRKEWFDANKAQFQAGVLEPSVRFVRYAGDRLKKISPHIVGDARAFGGSVSRIYRDIRFSPDKSPYKTHMAIHFSHAKAGGPEHIAPGYYLHLESGESAVHSAVWRPEPPTARNIRDRFLDAPPARRKVRRSS